MTGSPIPPATPPEPPRVEDLTEEAPVEGGVRIEDLSNVPADVGAPAGIYTIEARREDTRTRLAYLVVGATLLIAILLVVVAATGHGDPGGAKDVGLPVFTALLGVASTVLGFYFATTSPMSSGSGTLAAPRASRTSPRRRLFRRGRRI